MTTIQKEIYKTLLKSKSIDRDTAKEAAITFEPCYCIVSNNGKLLYQGMQNNTCIVLAKYKKQNGYIVDIFEASKDLKLQLEQWAEIKEIVKGLR